MALISLDSLYSAPRSPLLPNSLSLISHSVLYKRHLRQFNISIRTVSVLLNDCNEKKRSRPIEKIKNANVLREKNNTLRGIRNSLKDRSMLMKDGDGLIEEQKNVDEQFNDQTFNDLNGTCPEINDFNHDYDITVNGDTHHNMNQNALGNEKESRLNIVLKYPSKPRPRKSPDLHILSELRQKLKQTMRKYESVEMGRIDGDYELSIGDNCDNQVDNSRVIVQDSDNLNNAGMQNNMDTSVLFNHMDRAGISNDPNMGHMQNNLNIPDADHNDSLSFLDLLDTTNSSFSLQILPDCPLFFNSHVKNLSKLEKISCFFSLLIQLERGTVVAEQNGCYGEIKVERTGYLSL